MEISITSMESVRPFSPQVDVRKPFKLSYIDQLMLPHYSPFIWFYTKSNNPHLDSAQISSPLKKSLSKALNVFYPLSGRVVDNYSIDYFDEGVPFTEARVSGCVSDYLQPLELDKMNELLPYEGFRYHPNPESLPLLAVRENIFDCGGIALSVCCSHKIIDGSTISSFLRIWTAFCRGCNGEIPQPDLLEASSRHFPPRDQPPPQEILSATNTSLFNEGRYKTKAFAFNANSVDTLILKAKSKSLQRPSKTEALTAFIWKHEMLASRSASGIVKPSTLIQVVDLRRKVKPRLPDYAIGNLLGSIYETYEPDEKDNIELHDLALRMRKSLKNFSMQESQRAEGDHESLGSTSWFNFRMHEIDFGWGKPTWFGFPGLVAPAYSNLVILRDVGEDNTVEAWVTLDEKIMDMLEHDPEFLAFANPNPHYH